MDNKAEHIKHLRSLAKYIMAEITREGHYGIEILSKAKQLHALLCHEEEEVKRELLKEEVKGEVLANVQAILHGVKVNDPIAQEIVKKGEENVSRQAK